MILPWTSRSTLERRRDKLEDELAELRKQIAKAKKRIKRLEKDLYWGKISITEMKRERRTFVSKQKRIRSVKKKLRRVETRLDGKVL